MKEIEYGRARKLCESWLAQHEPLGIVNKAKLMGDRWIQTKTEKVWSGFFRKNTCPVCGDEMIFVKILCRRRVIVVHEETGDVIYHLTDAPRKLPLLVETLDRCFFLDGEKFRMPKSPEFGVCSNRLHEVARFGAYRAEAVLLGFSEIFQQFNGEHWIRSTPCKSL